MILYRPVGLQELELIYDSGMKAFPARLPQQPIFYPVLQLEYARKVASDWNAKNGQLAGYITQFKVEDEYIGQFEEHTIGGSQHREFWIPAEEMEEFNKHIVGHIKVLEAHFGDVFEGFIPDKFGLQGKNAVEQFTLLANSFVYKRMDFYLEIKRNHKAVFLNYPFWLTYDFKNPGLKEKVLQAIKEGWLASFPQTPLPQLPALPEASPPEAQVESNFSVSPARADIPPVERQDPPPRVNLAYKDSTPVRPIEEDTTPESPAAFEPIDGDITPLTKIPSRSLEDAIPEEIQRTNRKDSGSFVKPRYEESAPVQPTALLFAQGIKLALSGKYQEAIHELSEAVEEDPYNVIAHVSLGVVFHWRGEDDRALTCYETALKLDPKHAEAHYFRANILYRRGSVREAIAEYTQAIGLHPELVESHEQPVPEDHLTDYSALPAEIYRIARPARRILTLNQLLRTNPRQAGLLKERGAAYERLGNYEQAIADYSASLALQPEDASVLHSRGVVYEQLGQHDRAQEDFHQAAARNQSLANEYLQRGVTYGSMGNLRQSIASLTEGIRLAPENPDGYFNRGAAYLQQGDLAGAIADFSSVIRLSPNDESAYYWRAICNEEAGRREEAIADYREFLVISQDPQASEEVEQKLNAWNVGKPNEVSSRKSAPQEEQESDRAEAENPQRGIDLYDLIAALGERALRSLWTGTGVDCYGENAEELLSFIEGNHPMEGDEFLQISAGIDKTLEGNFTAFDPGSASPWIIIRAWEGSGFYMETNDRKSRERLRTHFPSLEDVEGADPPYEGFFIRL